MGGWPCQASSCRSSAGLSIAFVLEGWMLFSQQIKNVVCRSERKSLLSPKPLLTGLTFLLVWKHSKSEPGPTSDWNMELLILGNANRQSKKIFLSGNY
jgi:hypothetical protein